MPSYNHVEYIPLYYKSTCTSGCWALIEVFRLISCFFPRLIHISLCLMFLFHPTLFSLCCILLISSALMCHLFYSCPYHRGLLTFNSLSPPHQFPFSSSLGWKRWIGPAAQVLVYLSSLATEPAGEVPYMRLAHIKRAPFRRRQWISYGWRKICFSNWFRPGNWAIGLFHGQDSYLQ